jgi:hypothetical protein
MTDIQQAATTICYLAENAQDELHRIGNEWTRPSTIYRPALMADGTKWCALYGPDLQVGVAGFGDTPAEAMADFDRAWVGALTPKAQYQVNKIADEEAREEVRIGGQFGHGA